MQKHCVTVSDLLNKKSLEMKKHILPLLVIGILFLLVNLMSRGETVNNKQVDRRMPTKNRVESAEKLSSELLSTTKNAVGEEKVEENKNPIKSKTKKNAHAGYVDLGGKTAYEIMSVAFEGFPREKEIKPMMDEVLMRYGQPINDQSRIKFGDMLVLFRKNSLVGMTEMEILKHMYQRGSSSRTLQDQAIFSAGLIETTK